MSNHHHQSTHTNQANQKHASAPHASATDLRSCSSAAEAGSTQPGPESSIRLRAYEISQARNGGPGDATADWMQAEREVGVRHEAKR